ncbi:MAG: family 1 glycosylhydrolase [Herpetosiphonaceae bacterium]|nr:family 1 glycosylhydrolase [Herpetosiphonaceae bacterium]
MNGLPSGAANDFVWATGIEDTFVPQVRPGYRALDEYELMGHYEHWREDLHLTQELGIRAVRWGIPWYRVEPAPGEFDWRWTDEVLPYLVQELCITPIIDLMHYGCPLWLHREFANDEYPQAVAEYAAAFARRYHGLIRWYTPLNEPLINSVMSGRRGQWPPYLRGDGGYIRVMMQLIKGIRRTVTAIKQIDPQALMVHVEAAGLHRAMRAELEALATEEQHRGYLSYDLLTGRVKPTHPLYTWLLRHSTNPDDLAEFERTPIGLDVLGLNFYPQWSTKQVEIDARGRLLYRNVEKDGASFGSLIRDYYERYKVPVMITETSAKGSVTTRSKWLTASLAAIKELRGQGVPVLGYTWFPLFTMIDWRYRMGREPLERYRIELGLYTLNRESAERRWQTTPLVQQFISYVNNPAEAIGVVKGFGTELAMVQ